MRLEVYVAHFESTIALRSINLDSPIPPPVATTPGINPITEALARIPIKSRVPFFKSSRAEIYL